MDDDIEIPQNADDLSPAKHPCSKFFVRVVTVITCLHMILRRRTTAMEDELLRCRTFSFILTCAPNSELDNFADLDRKDILQYVLRWLMFGSFPTLSLLVVLFTGPLMTLWPRLSTKLIISPTLMHVLCLFSLFYMFMESVFESFSFIYSVSNAHSSLTAPWSTYLLSSLYTLILWFFFLNFIVNIQLAEFDCRIAREIAAAIVDVNDDDVIAIPN